MTDVSLETARLLSQLACNDREIRARAAEALGRLGDPRLIPPLCTALRDDDWSVRAAAAKALGVIGDATAVPSLCAALKDENWTVRPPAADALGLIGDGRAVEALGEALLSDNWLGRSCAARALGRIGDPRALPALRTALGDADQSVRNAAVAAIGCLGDAASAVLPDLLRCQDAFVRSSAMEHLSGRDAPVIAALLADAFYDREPAIRAKAVGALAQCGESGLAQLRAAFRSLDPVVAGAAESALLALGKPGIDAISEALQDASPRVRCVAGTTLGRIRDPDCTPFLIAALRDEDLSVRAVAARALGSSRDERVFPYLCRALYDDQEPVRRAAAEALGELGDVRAIDPLSRALAEDAGAAQQCACALAKFGAPSVPALRELLRETEAFVRDRAIAALIMIGAPSGPAMRDALNDSHWCVRYAAVQVLDRISDSHSMVRVCVAASDKSEQVRTVVAVVLAGRNSSFQITEMLSSRHATASEKLDALNVMVRYTTWPKSELAQVGSVPKYCLNVTRSRVVSALTRAGADEVLAEIKRRGAGATLLRPGMRESEQDVKGLLRAAESNAGAVPSAEMLRPSAKEDEVNERQRTGFFARLLKRR